MFKNGKLAMYYHEIRNYIIDYFNQCAAIFIILDM